MAETRDIPDVPRRDDAFLIDGVRVCPLADNSVCACWWVRSGRPTPGPAACLCEPPYELWGRGR